MGSAMTMAEAKPRGAAQAAALTYCPHQARTFSFSSMESVAPKSPAMMPRGRPKFSPQPDCTIGIIASTITAFMPKRTSVSDSEVSTRTPTNGAAMNSPSRNRPMMTRGQPAFSINFLIMIMPSPPHSSSWGRFAPLKPPVHHAASAPS